MATNIVLKRSATQNATPSTSDLELGELALNTYDGKMYMKKTVSGTSSIVELTGTVAASSSAFAYESFKYTASSNQTTFTGSDADSKTLAYTAGQIQVYLNGVLLDATDYTASNGSSVVLGSGATSGDILVVKNFSGTNPFDYFKYTATNAQTTFTGNDANSESLVYTVGNITVHLNGVLLDASDYTATSGTSVVLGSAAASGDILVIHEFNETALTDLSADTSPQLAGNLDVVTYDIVSTSNRNIDIKPNGSGNIVLDNHTWPNSDGSANQVLKTDGSGALSFTSISSDEITDADGNTKIQVEESSNENIIRFDISGTEQIVLADGVLKPTTDNDIDLGTSSLEFKDAFFDGTVTSDAFAGPLTGDVTGNADTATVSTSITASANNSTDETVYPTFVDGATGTQGIETDTGLTYNPSSGVITATQFTGAVSGNASTATEATNVTASANNSTDETVYPTFVDGATGTQGIETDTGLTYNPSSGLLTSTLLAGTLNTAAQANVTSLGTLTTLTVDNVIVNGTTIGHTSDTDLMTLTSGNLTVAGDVYIGDSNKELRFYEGSNYIGFEAPALSANQIWVLPSADGSANQTLKTDGSGNLSWATAASAVSNLTDATISSATSGDYLRYNGSAWVNVASAGNPVVDTMTGDASDTTLTLTRAPLHENAVQVYWDGVYQTKDNWAVSGTTLTFDTAPPSGVKVEAVTGSQTNILYGNDVTVDKMTGDNSDTTLSLSVTPSNENHTNVYFDGVYQSKDNYTLSGTTITFSTAPPTGVLVEAVSNQSVSIGTATAIAASAVTGLTEVTAADADHIMIYDSSGSALKKALVSDLIQTGEEIADTIGAMVSSNTETGISVTYQDGDNTIDFALDAAQTSITSLLATDIKIGEDDQTKIDFETADEIHFYAANAEQVYIADGVFGPQTDADVDLGTSGVEFKDLFLDGTAHIDTLDVDANATITGTLGVTGVTTSNAGIVVDELTIDADTITATDDFIIDAAGDIILDADDADWFLKDAGTTIMHITNNSGSTEFYNATSDGDIIFKGNDGGSTVSALTLNMSDAGDAHFNRNVGIGAAPTNGGVSTAATALLSISGAVPEINLIDTDSSQNDYWIRVSSGLQFGEASDSRMYLANGGNLGLGTTAPNEAGFGSDTKVLSIQGASADNFGVLELISPDVTSSNRIGEIRFGNLDGGSSFASNAGMRATRDGADNSSALSLWTTDAGTFTEAMSIDSKQRVKAAKAAMITQVALTSSSNAVAWDASAAANAYHVTTENTTFGAPSNATEGAIISVEIAQGGTARTIAWNTVFEFAASTAPTMTATASKTDIYSFRYNGSVWQEIGRVQNMAQT